MVTVGDDAGILAGFTVTLVTLIGASATAGGMDPRVSATSLRACFALG
ncbi:hypothetical protein [Mesorhizobium muleiense]|nr:hypothetical protein [Mesorhizobium muleiense]